MSWCSALRRAQRRRGQRGETLIEILLTVFIMGTVLLSLIGLLMTVVLSSAAHRGSVASGNQATTISETIDRLPYIQCGSISSYSSAATGFEPGYTGEVVSVRHLQDGSASQAVFLPAGTPCPSGVDQGAQLIRIEVRMTLPPYSKGVVEMVKRDVSCPAGITEANGRLRAGESC